LVKVKNAAVNVRFSVKDKLLQKNLCGGGKQNVLRRVFEILFFQTLSKFALLLNGFPSNARLTGEISTRCKNIHHATFLFSPAAFCLLTPSFRPTTRRLRDRNGYLQKTSLPY